MVPVVTKNRTARGTPFISNVEKEVYAKRKGFEPGVRREKEREREGDRGTPVLQSREIPLASTMEPTLKLEMFAPKQPPPKPYGLYAPYVPTVQLPGTSTRFSPTDFQHLGAPTCALSYGPYVRMPMQQVYNINLPGPTGDHVLMNKIYENIMPGREAKLTFTTMGERLQIYDYLRQMLIKIDDGEDISIDSDGHNSLLSYIKFMELNSNYYSPIYSNPYEGLPFGLLIYRSCFPIKFDKLTQSVLCNKESIGLSIRIYSLSCAEYYSYLFRQLIYKEYDVWRELAYYEYIRENILKKKQSPNFPLMYAFFLSPNRKIDFFSLKKKCLTQKDMLTSEYKRFCQVHTLFSSVQPPDKYIWPMTLPDAARKVIAKLPDEIDPALQGYSGTVLILVTEAPHHNLYQWACRTYEKDGIVNKMISHGFYDEKVWLNVIFQIVSALHVMQLHGIYMRCMTIQDNIYIKDLTSYGKAMGYWKYVINGVPFYVPNYGYIVMVDSNFKDIVPPGATIDRCKREYKIYTSNIIGKRYALSNIQKKVFENYRTIINTNSFTKEYTMNNVNKPPASIMKLLEGMMADPETDLGKVIIKHFRPLMNNRIGTLLRKDEVPNIRSITSSFANGEMAIEVIEQDLYKWCLVTASDGQMVEIITRDDPLSSNFITSSVRVETLKQFSPSEKIEQNIVPNLNLSEDELLETYLVS